MNNIFLLLCFSFIIYLSKTLSQYFCLFLCSYASLSPIHPLPSFLSTYFSLFLCVSLTLSSPLHLCVFLYFSHSISLSLYLSLSLSFIFPIFLSLSLSLFLCLSHSISFSLFLSFLLDSAEFEKKLKDTGFVKLFPQRSGILLVKLTWKIRKNFPQNFNK